jgi:hypothetical protein
MRRRVLARFNELEDERAQIDAHLVGLAAAAPAAANPALGFYLPRSWNSGRARLKLSGVHIP